MSVKNGAIRLEFRRALIFNNRLSRIFLPKNVGMRTGLILHIALKFLVSAKKRVQILVGK